MIEKQFTVTVKQLIKELEQAENKDAEVFLNIMGTFLPIRGVRIKDTSPDNYIDILAGSTSEVSYEQE